MLMDFGNDLQMFWDEYDSIYCLSDLGHNYLFNPESVKSRYPNQSDIKYWNYLGGKSIFKLKNLCLFRMKPTE